jgi:hypothetical protein
LPTSLIEEINSTRNLITQATQGAVLSIKVVRTIGKQVAVLGIHDKQKAVEKDKALIPTQEKVAIRVERILGTTEKAANGCLKGVEDAPLEALAYPKAIDIAPFDGTLDQRLALVGARETNGAEEQIEL